MVIEWLKFKVDPEGREIFIEKDREIWTATLAQYKGFLGKEIWIEPKVSDELTLIIHWETREDWYGVPRSVLDETDIKFSQAMGNNFYELVEAKEYQVRKFMNGFHNS